MTGLPAMILTAIVVLGATAIAILALGSGRLDILAKATKVSIVWLAAYMSLLVGVSTGSKTVVLPPGERKAFCGAYLDCHMGVSIVRSWTAPHVDLDQSKWVAKGKFLFVNVEVSSDARAVPLRLHEPGFILTDRHGRRFERLEHLEFEIATHSGQRHSLTTSLNPEESFEKTLVFDVPADALGPGLTLEATDGSWFDRAIELFLIGDEDSLLHRPVLLALERPVEPSI